MSVCLCVCSQFSYFHLGAHHMRIYIFVPIKISSLCVLLIQPMKLNCNHYNSNYACISHFDMLCMLCIEAFRSLSFNSSPLAEKSGLG